MIVAVETDIRNLELYLLSISYFSRRKKPSQIFKIVKDRKYGSIFADDVISRTPKHTDYFKDVN